MPERNVVVAAVPDQLHYEVILCALRHDQHVLTVKPLVLRLEQALEIEREAYSRGLVVGIEYHKRFDDRSLMARRKYREGLFGEFRLGTACLLEKWYYRHSNFQNWMTAENSDAFTYIGCHYVDLVALHHRDCCRRRSASMACSTSIPNGSEGYLWTDARIVWNNGACLNVQNALGFPDQAPGTNAQGLTMYCSGGEDGALIAHSDQYRGLKYSYTCKADDPGSTAICRTQSRTIFSMWTWAVPGWSRSATDTARWSTLSPSASAWKSRAAIWPGGRGCCSRSTRRA